MPTQCVCGSEWLFTSASVSTLMSTCLQSGSAELVVQLQERPEHVCAAQHQDATKSTRIRVSTDRARY